MRTRSGKPFSPSWTAAWLHGEGGYSRNSEQVLLSVISNRQLPKLEKIAHLIDPTCFMIVSHVTEVSGRGFSLEKDYKEED